MLRQIKKLGAGIGWLFATATRATIVALVGVGVIGGILSYAADNYAATEGAGKNFRCVDVAGICIPWFTLSNSAGVEIGTRLNPVQIAGTISQGGNSAIVTTAGALTISSPIALPFTSSGTLTVSGTGVQAISIQNAPATLTVSGTGAQGVHVQGTVTTSPTGTLPVGVIGTANVNVTNNVPVTCTGCSAAATVTISQGGNAAVVNSGGQLFVSSQISGSGNAAAVTASNALKVDPSAVTQPVNITGGLNTNGQAAMSASAPVVIAGNQTAVAVVISANSTNTVGALAAGNNAIGTVGISAVSSGGWSSFSMVNGPQSFGVIKAGPGIVHAQQSYTISSSSAWLKFYDTTSATPQCGSPASTPMKKAILIPANSTAALGGGNNSSDLDIQFSTGIAYCVTTNMISTDVVSPTANNFIINVDFK